MSLSMSETTAQQAEKIYQRRLKDQLEASQRGKFVAIEPISGDYFLANSLSEAIGAAREAHPDRLAHALRVGHKATVHLGSID